MQRRKFVIGLGALASGTAAAVGTGAFTSASVEDRAINVEVTGDADSRVALVAGESEDIYQNEEGQLQLDLAGDDGVNINSVYEWGDNDNAAEQYAFKIVNNSPNDYETVGFGFEFNDDSWQDDEVEYTGQADPEHNFLRFTAHSGQYTGRLRAPDYSSWQGDGIAENSSMVSQHTGDARLFTAGEVWEVVVEVNTTGDRSTKDQDLSGKLTIDVSDPR